MINKIERVANFTSSENYKLTVKGRGEFGFGEKALTYIKEKQMESRLGRSINVGAYSRAIAWGNFMELFVFEQIGLEYKIRSKSTEKHPTIDRWTGSCDLIVPEKKIGEIKCYEPKNFCTYADALLTGNTSVIKEECPKEYWQLVSNAIINQVPNAEAILFMPYKSELEEIKQMALDYSGTDQWKYRFIYESEDNDLPYLPDGGYYKNMNRFEFEVPKEDIEFLTERVLKAIELLTRKP